jgi:hypothetical protein
VTASTVVTALQSAHLSIIPATRLRSGGTYIPLGRQVSCADCADEVLVAYDVDLTARRAATEQQLVREVGRVLDSHPVQRRGDSRPRIRVWTVAGRLVADLLHGPTRSAAGEAHLTRGQDVLADGTGDVLTAAGRQAEKAVEADDECERLGQLGPIPAAEPLIQDRRRANRYRSRALPSPNCGTQLGRTNTLPNCGTQLSRTNPAPNYSAQLGRTNTLPNCGTQLGGANVAVSAWMYRHA